MKKTATNVGASTSAEETRVVLEDWSVPDEEPSSGVEESSTDETEVGESSSSCTTRPKRAFGCVPAHPRNEHVDDKLRAKIRDGEYVDFKLMLPRSRDEKPKKRFSIIDGLFEEVEDNTNMVFYSWIDAYIVFMSIHLEFYPTDVQGMLRHFEIVKGFHVSGKDGIEYDYQFRRLKSRNSDIVWGEYMAELAGSLKEYKQEKKVEKKADQPTRKPGRVYYCNKFNQATGCKFGNGCKFVHKCRKCYSPDHPEYRCSKK